MKITTSCPGRSAALGAAVALVFVLTGAPLACGAHPATAPGGVSSILELYNAGIRRAEASIESLRVVQDMTEPRSDGAALHERAALSYTRTAGMERRVLSSDLVYPAGEYTLASLVGPPLEPSEYRVRLAGAETMDGVACYRLEVEAVVRDRDHLDGDVWVSRDGCSLVRIAGAVSDPPFPLAEIRLDKRFAAGPCGLSLLRSHTGEVRAGLVLGRKAGVRHITYSAYVVNGMPEGPRLR